jgi:large subunit ribosomal protein L6
VEKLFLVCVYYHDFRWQTLLRKILNIQMVSLLISPTVTLSVAPSLLRIKGPLGHITLFTGSLRFRLVDTSEGKRLFVESSITNSHLDKISPEIAYTHIKAARDGITQGYRRRLRLVGVGYRATTQNVAGKTNETVLSRKVGYSHELTQTFSSNEFPGLSVVASRPEGRTKGTVVLISGQDQSQVNRVAADLRGLRYPNPYTGKGVIYDRENIRRKKGKREKLKLSN